MTVGGVSISDSPRHPSFHSPRRPSSHSSRRPSVRMGSSVASSSMRVAISLMRGAIGPQQIRPLVRMGSSVASSSKRWCGVWASPMITSREIERTRRTLRCDLGAISARSRLSPCTPRPNPSAVVLISTKKGKSLSSLACTHRRRRGRRRTGPASQHTRRRGRQPRRLFTGGLFTGGIPSASFPFRKGGIPSS